MPIAVFQLYHGMNKFWKKYTLPW